MSGGKSSSASKQSQETSQTDVSGLVAGDNQQIQGDGNLYGQTALKAERGSEITIGTIEQIPEAVGQAFHSLVNTVNNSLEAVQSVTAAGQKIVSDTTAAAITSVSQRTEAATNPELSAITKLAPLAIVATVAVIIIKVLK